MSTKSKNKNAEALAKSDHRNQENPKYTLAEKLLIPGLAAIFVLIGIVVTHIDNQKTYNLVKKEMEYSILKDYIVFVAENQNSTATVVAVDIASKLEAGTITLSEALSTLNEIIESEQRREMKTGITSLFNTEFSIQQDAVRPLRETLSTNTIGIFIDFCRAEIELQNHKELNEETYKKGVELIIYILQCQSVDIYKESGQVEAVKNLLNMDEVIEAQGTYYRRINLLEALNE